MRVMVIEVDPELETPEGPDHVVIRYRSRGETKHVGMEMSEGLTMLLGLEVSRRLTRLSSPVL